MAHISIENLTVEFVYRRAHARIAYWV